MKRVTAEQVAEAYKRTGLKPITGLWLDGTCGPRRKPTCGCGMGALFLDAGGAEIECCSPTIGKVLDLELDYVLGFSDGFDGVPSDPSKWFWGPDSDHAEYEAGYEDGKAAGDLMLNRS